LQGCLKQKAPGGFEWSISRAIRRFYLEVVVTNKNSVVVMTLVGKSPKGQDPPSNQIATFPAPPGFCWRLVPESPFAVQVRSILRIDARAVVVWVGAEDAISRAANLIGRILGTGPPIVIAVAEVHDPWSESVLRQAGALYLCANEAEQRLGHVLESILGPPSLSIDVKTAPSMREVKTDSS
jgi:hypothetical protein